MIPISEPVVSSNGAGSVGAARDDVSLFALGAVLVRHRRRILSWAVVGGLLAVVPVLLRSRAWTSTASFIPQRSESSQGGIQNLAGQFGIMLPGAGASTQSPDFYVTLLSSRAVLAPIAGDTMTVTEEGGRRRTLRELFNVTSGGLAEQADATTEVLRAKITTSVDRTTGIVNLSVQTHWGSVSYALAQRLLRAVNEFNLHVRQSQAGEERRFAEARLEAQRVSLSTAEARLSAFLRTNRQFGNSPELTFENGRLQRDVALQQQVLVGLAQSYEEARLREVRDLPVVTVIEPPELPVKPDRRGAVSIGLIGVLGGALLGILLSFMREGLARRRAEGDADAERFATVVAEARADLGRRLSFRRSVDRNIAVESDVTGRS